MTRGVSAICALKIWSRDSLASSPPNPVVGKCYVGRTFPSDDADREDDT